MDRAHLDWPFFADAHRALARGLAAWCAGLPAIVGADAEDDVDGQCLRLVRALRICEGATDVQRRIVGRAVLAASKENDA